MKNKIIALTGMLLTVFTLSGNDDFKYSRSLSGITDVWHLIELPDDLFMNADKTLHDLRIIGITENKDTIEVPYFLKIKEGLTVRKKVDFKLVNESVRQGNRYVTVEVTRRVHIDEIDLDLGNSNFDWKVSLEGSHDQKEWFQVLDDYRILSIDNAQTKYAFTTLIFPASNYPFYRIAFPDKDAEINRVSLLLSDYKEPGFMDYGKVDYADSLDKNNKETILDISLKKPVPVSFINLQVNEDLDFYRPISIDVARDSTSTPKGWIHNYRNVSRGVLNSIEDPEFSFNQETVRKIRIRIKNFDNAPLDIGDITVKGYQHELVARFTEKADYFLRYGNRKLSKPNYDIVQFKSKIPDELSKLVIGEETFTGKKEVKPTPMMSDKFWLWGVLVLIVLVMGWFTLGMIKKN